MLIYTGHSLPLTDGKWPPVCAEMIIFDHSTILKGASVLPDRWTLAVDLKVYRLGKMRPRK